MAKNKRKSQGIIKRHHGFSVLIMVLGWVVPPLAVLVRFGIGLDFFLNIILTIAGYIPGHFHNFYLQNIRNNKNAKHSPRWAVRAGLVKDYKKKPSNGWDDRYGEGAEAYDRQQIEVDPITGETRLDPDAGKRLGGRPRPVKKSKLISPWRDNPESEDWAERFGTGNARTSEREDQDEDFERDEITGAIIGQRNPRDSQPDAHAGGVGAGIKRTQSRNSTRSTASRYNYADRYGLNGRGNNNHSSSSSSFINPDHNSSNSSFKNQSISKSKSKSIFKKEKKEKNRFQRENENGYDYDYERRERGNDASVDEWNDRERGYGGASGSGNRNERRNQDTRNDASSKRNNDPLNDGFQF